MNEGSNYQPTILHCWAPGYKNVISSGWASQKGWRISSCPLKSRAFGIRLGRLLGAKWKLHPQHILSANWTGFKGRHQCRKAPNEWPSLCTSTISLWKAPGLTVVWPCTKFGCTLQFLVHHVSPKHQEKVNSLSIVFATKLLKVRI